MCSISVGSSMLPAVFSRVAGFLALFLALSLTSGFIRLRTSYACLILVTTISVYVIAGHFVQRRGTLVDRLHSTDETAFVSPSAVLVSLIGPPLLSSDVVIASLTHAPSEESLAVHSY